MVTFKMLAKSFPDYTVSSINNYYDKDIKYHYIALTNQDFNTIYVRLDEDGKVINLQELVKERDGVKV